MKTLDECRVEIDRIDREMVKLFEERMKASKEVANYKIKHALPIFDASREQEVINQNLQYIEDDEIKEYYVNFLKETMNISKKYQQKLMERI